MTTRTLIEAIRDGMAEEMRRDPSVVVMGEDVGKKGGVFLATDGLWARVRRRPRDRHAADGVDDRRAARSGPR